MAVSTPVEQHHFDVILLMKSILAATMFVGDRTMASALLAGVAAVDSTLKPDSWPHVLRNVPLYSCLSTLPNVHWQQICSKSALYIIKQAVIHYRVATPRGKFCYFLMQYPTAHVLHQLLVTEVELIMDRNCFHKCKLHLTVAFTAQF